MRRAHTRAHTRKTQGTHKEHTKTHKSLLLCYCFSVWSLRYYFTTTAFFILAVAGGGVGSVCFVAAAVAGVAAAVVGVAGDGGVV